MEVTRKDYVQAVVTYFDVGFTHCKETIQLSMSPFTETTYWKQTVFYLEDHITAQQGEEIWGTFRMWSHDHKDYGETEFDISVQQQVELKCLTEKTMYKLR